MSEHCLIRFVIDFQAALEAALVAADGGVSSAAFRVSEIGMHMASAHSESVSSQRAQPHGIGFIEHPSQVWCILY
jgi:hypothetical protein